MNCIAGGGDETDDPRRSRKKNTPRETQSTYTGKGNGAGGLFFSDRNSGRRKEKKPSRNAGGLFESGN
jgi:hypothetical protein